MATDTLDPATTAVLFIECQNGLLGDDSVMRALANAAGPAKEAMGRLATGARESGALVAHLTYAPLAGNRSSNRRPPLFARLLPSLDDWHPDHPAVQPIPEIGVGASDLVLQRHTGLSPTYGTETYKLLRNVGVKTVVMAGISINIAIPVAATEATDEDFDVIIPRDATIGTPQEHVQSMFEHTLPFIATVTTVDDLLTAWKAKKGSDGTGDRRDAVGNAGATERGDP